MTITRRAFVLDDMTALGPSVELLDTRSLCALARTTAFTWLDDGHPVACGGVECIHLGVGECWMLLSSPPPAAWRALVKEIRRFAFEEYIPSLCLHRVQCLVNLNFPQGHAIAQFFHFFPECILRRYGPNGEDFMMYASFPVQECRK